MLPTLGPTLTLHALFSIMSTCVTDRPKLAYSLVFLNRRQNKFTLTITNYPVPKLWNFATCIITPSPRDTRRLKFPLYVFTFFKNFFFFEHWVADTILAPHKATIWVIFQTLIASLFILRCMASWLPPYAIIFFGYCVVGTLLAIFLRF